MRLAIGALLLTFATALTAGFFVYQFMFNLAESMKTAFPTRSLQLESVNINSTCITISVRNFASVNIQITNVYINGETYSLTDNIFISPSNIGVIHLHGTYMESETYTVKIASSLGSPLIIDVKYD